MIRFPAATLVAVLWAVAPAAGAEGGEALLAASGATLTRLSTANHDAVRPRLSGDGLLLAYVRRSHGEADARGEEIWVVDLQDRSARRRVGREDLGAPETEPARGSFHDLSWSPDSRRLAFTWYDGKGWARIMVSDTGLPVARLSVPSVMDTWEEGTSFTLSATQFVWSEGGRSGTMVVWDDDCASLYRVGVPPAGSAAGGAGVEIPLAGGCRPLMIEGPDHWLYKTREADFSQRLGVVDRSGSVIESRLFRQDAVVFARWGAHRGDGSGSDRPPALLWWTYSDRTETVMAVWESGHVTPWTRAPCRRECPEPLLIDPRGLWYIEEPQATGRLMLMEAPGAGAREILPSGVASLRPLSGDTSWLAVIRGQGGKVGIWRMDLPR